MRKFLTAEVLIVKNVGIKMTVYFILLELFGSIFMNLEISYMMIVFSLPVIVMDEKLKMGACTNTSKSQILYNYISILMWSVLVNLCALILNRILVFGFEGKIVRIDTALIIMAVNIMFCSVYRCIGEHYGMKKAQIIYGMILIIALAAFEIGAYILIKVNAAGLQKIILFFAGIYGNILKEILLIMIGLAVWLFSFRISLKTMVCHET